MYENNRIKLCREARQLNISGCIDQMQTIYARNLQRLSTRSHRLILSLPGADILSRSHIEGVLGMEMWDILQLKGCGMKSVNELLEFIDELRAEAEHLIKEFPPIQEENIQQDTDGLLPFTFDDEEVENSVDSISTLPCYVENLTSDYKKRASQLSVRAKNVVLALFESCNSSITDLYEAITAIHFNVADLKNCGKGTVPEITVFLEEIKALIEDYAVNYNEEEALIEEFRSSISSIVPSKENQDFVINFKNTHGYFPYFKIVQWYIDSLSDSYRRIIEVCIRTYGYSVILDRKIVGAELSLSPERVRQLRNSILNKMREKFIEIRRSFNNPACPYVTPHNDPYNVINATEEVHFSDNFTNWALSILFDSHVLIGDVEDVLFSFYNTNGRLSIFPAELTEAFDFKQFISTIEERISEKRKDLERCPLEDLICPLCADNADLESTMQWCRKFLSHHYELQFNGDDVIFPVNTYKTLTEITYDIIKAHGKPMSSDELVAAVSAAYPDRDYKIQSVCTSARAHPHIDTIGRNSLYTLREWTDGAERGGTIREFVEEYLATLDLPIARLSDIAEYVKQYRPNTEAYNIQNNLTLEASHKFKIYIKGGERYIGYSSEVYPDGYEGYECNLPDQRTTDESIKLLIEFIKTHQRFPRLTASADEEEKRLCRFVGVRRNRCSKGLLSEKAKQQWIEFEEEYGVYDTGPKKK